jgi:hypothetical protein
MKKISTVFAVGIVMFTLAGCVPGETVVTISADDVGCVMTGGVGRVEMVTTLTNTIPKIDLSKASKLGLKHFGLSATNTPLEVVQKVFKGAEEIYSVFLSKGDTIKLSAKEQGTNIFVTACIKRKAVFVADLKKLPAEHAKDLCLYIDEKRRLTFAGNQEQLEMVSGLLLGYIDLAINSEEFTEYFEGFMWYMSDPFSVKSDRIRILGEGQQELTSKSWSDLLFDIER